MDGAILPAVHAEAKVRTVSIADLFCGAGGSSTAAVRAVEARGMRAELVAVNHWPVAVATHQANHPGAMHFCQDVEVLRPRDAVPSGRLDVLLASPECTHHSRARGGRPVVDQKRATAWCVPRWCADLYVGKFLVENVAEFRQWGPIDSRGRPIKSREGETFQAWCSTLENMGNRIDVRELNCADYGDPTTRRRLFVMGRRDGRRIVWPEASHEASGEASLFGPRERWRPARDVIDWGRKGRSVFGRKAPLKPNTLRRLMAGVSRYFGVLAPVYLDALERELARSIERWGDVAKGKAPRIAPHSDAAPPIPFLLGQHAGNAARSVDDPVMTLCAGGAVALVAPYYGGGSGLTCKPVDDPLDTVTAKARFGLLEPFMLQLDQTGGGGDRTRPVSQPLPTIVTVQTMALAAPVIEIDGERIVCDLLYRMIAWDELARAMSFPDDYQFAGNATEITRQIGNAVPGRTVNTLVGALLDTGR